MKENKNMNNVAANNNFNNNEGGVVMTTGTMTMDVFAGTVKEALAVYFEDCTIQVQEVKKNNGRILHGLTIREQESNLAPTMAHRVISESRTGIMSNEGDIARINDIISPLVRNGQSLHQVYLEHVDDLMCSEKTLYNYVDARLFDVRNIDLPRKVKYRPRYKQPEFKVDRGCRVGRNYSDFQKFLEDNPETTIVQMDTVIGRIGGKCLLTVHFVETSLMLAFLRDANTSGSVIRIFNVLDEV